MLQIEIYNLQTSIVQFKYQKKLKTYLIVKIELSLNENKLNGHKYRYCLNSWNSLEYVL